MSFLKTCPKCGVQKTSDDYYQDFSRIDKLEKECKTCSQRRLKVSNTIKKRRRKQNLKKYELTIGQYDQMLEKQCGYCYICLTHSKELNKKLAVDHDHNTGKVRGLLCMKCNTVLGKVKESIFILERMIEYLKKYGAYNEKRPA